MSEASSLPGLSLSPRNIFCIGRNYAEHAKELNNPVPSSPVVFLKPTSALLSEGGAIVLPAESHNVHHEVEVVVAIGRAGRDVPADRAVEWIAGYAVGIDVTARDLQDEAKKKGLPWSVAKGFATFAPVSRFVPASEAGHADHTLLLTINGQIRQSGCSREMLFPIPQLIAYLSHVFTLGPGDLIFTGTPKGVGPLQAGDHIVAELDGGLARMELSVERDV